ncbi:MAG: helix-turn-helix transcriptional regulator [Clostridia bacterium]|nr:helix-turn-helix transcriptional regulator [Clostridia bacterium]
MLKARGLYVRFAEYSDAQGFMLDESHFHNHYEVYYLIKGRRRYIIENEIYDVQEGDIVLIPPMIMHKTQQIPGTDKSERHQRMLYNLREMPEILKPVFEKRLYRPTGEAREEIKRLIEESVQEDKISEEGVFLHRLNAHKILFILLRMPKDQPVLQKLEHRDQLMQNAACYIKEHCDKSISLREVADEMGFTPEYFSSVFKNVTGLNFVDYLNNMRIARALNLLNETDLPISKISEQCGFNDSNYFAIVFKKIMGISPRTYRNELKSKK